MSPWGKYLLENCDQVSDGRLFIFYKDICQYCFDEYMVKQVMRYATNIGINIYFQPHDE